MEVKFYNHVDDSLLKFAVIAAKYKGKWVFCKHKDRDTYEIAGGHREDNESIIDTAKRELYEETGACEFDLKPVSVYSVTGRNRVNSSGEETYGMLYYADIKAMEELPDSEIEKVYLFDRLPTELTYPLIQPILTSKVQKVIFENHTSNCFFEEENY
ncbi:MAG: NUDIX domain-containing protein [Sedimentibacter sp.]|uniref:NUDIX hydrolase n=1 Tax=Sedimentibacter sp. TaxID=1960295 RepID=UPI003158652A